MKLRNFRTNIPELRAKIPPVLLESDNLDIRASTGSSHKALGLHWKKSSDTLHVSTPQVSHQQVCSKRTVASLAAKVFDIIGWFSPVVVVATLIIREICDAGLSWDELLPEVLQRRWQTWINELPVITNHPIPRQISSSSYDVLTRELHGFSDASTVALDCIVYSIHQDMSITVDLFSSRARIPPQQKQTIPRLELNGAVILSKLLISVSHDLSIPHKSVYAWTDSSIVY